MFSFGFTKLSKMLNICLEKASLKEDSKPTTQQIHMIKKAFCSLLLWLLSHLHPEPQFKKMADKGLGLFRFPTVLFTQSHYVQRKANT